MCILQRTCNVNATNIRNVLGEDIPQWELDQMIVAGTGDASGNHMIAKNQLIALWRRMWESQSSGFDHK